eukprot:TRINITY_DN11021_c1_g2_i4.p1 TRINITY_DN11021_c1_g2~~TRINITY_DN11021_c1_g2_i4.p1  ORF type:complete len:123 (-),score=31.08 TRINITY_DN11021_c1_g2_i4:216-584(-)
MEMSGVSFDFEDVFDPDSTPPSKGEISQIDTGSDSVRSGNEDDQSVMAKLEKSRQSARECRARKKLRYQYLDDMIAEREKANLSLRQELEKYVSWCQQLDSNQVPEGLQNFLNSDMYKDGKM